ncbi:hypothetical protein [Bradyrhizobium australiense]|uniref:Helix-turn-helix domain-containing protein n=1 Tax=Bradyrhizobium australiense TaxID=2721161 RepID=A0A7Y4LV54_9BRAD|nr:hypothetical protein [Bradyrhizobium australiense]NOJ40003.1 hypothetical protein [Bradyrhizobium australiense]
MNTTPKLADVAPTPEAAALVGETLDNFRHRAREPGFPSSIKIGGVRFYNRRELAAWKRKRDGARNAR